MRDFTGLLVKYAGPSPRDKALVGNVAARRRLAQQQATRQYRQSHPNPLGSLNEQKAYLKQQGQRNLARLTPEQQQQFWNDAAKFQRGAMIGRGALAAAATAPYWGPAAASVAIKYGPKAARLWLDPMSGGRWYNYGLSALQNGGAAALSLLPPETVEKIPKPIRSIPAWSLLASPAGLLRALRWRGLGEALGYNGDVAKSVGGAATGAAANMVDNIVNARVPFLPKPFGLSLSSRKNLQAGLEHGLNKQINRTEDEAVQRARDAYDQGMAKIPGEQADRAGRIAPFEPIEQDIHDFYGKTLRGKVDYVRQLPEKAYEYAQGAVSRVKDEIPGIISSTWGNLSPEERDTAVDLGYDLASGAPIMRDNMRDIGDMRNGGSIARGVGRIAGRTVPWATQAVYDSRDAYGHYKQRIVNGRGKPPQAGLVFK